MSDGMQTNAGALSQAEIEAFRSRGCLIMPDVFGPGEVAAWREECDRLWARPEIVQVENFRIGWRRDDQGRTVSERIDPVIDISPPFRELANDERILNVARALLEDEATLLKDKLIYKWPGTDGYGAHQDHSYFAPLGLPTDGFVTIKVAIDSCDRTNGAVETFPGLHDARLPAPADEPRDVDETKLDPSRGEIMTTNAGSLLALHSMIPHRSGPNLSLGPRRTLFLTYSAVRLGDMYEVYYDTRLEELGPEISSDGKRRAFFR